MPRRKRQNLRALNPIIYAAFWVGGITLASPFLTAVYDQGSLISTAFVAVILVVLVLKAAQSLTKAVSKSRLSKTVNTAITRNLDTLIRRRAQLVGRDDYGAMIADRWHKEIDRFIESQVSPKLSQFQASLLLRRHHEIVEVIDARVIQEAAERPAFQALPANATPTEFEVFCAEQLRRIGWDAHVTKASRDQGTDVIAVKNGIRLVLQCKLYSKPVGNKAVQEATAGRLHERARFAAVVSNNGYTSAAEELARTNGVFLLHYSQLCEMDKLIQQFEVRTDDHALLRS